MNVCIDPELASLRNLGGIWIDPDQITRADFFQNDSGQQTIATPEVQAAASWKTLRHHVVDLNRTPKRRRGLERVLVKKSDEQVAIQRRSSSNFAS
jgi:hypothetical protein